MSERTRPKGHPKPAACDGCPAQARGRSYVPGAGPDSARVAIIGQGPGDVEASTGIPFHRHAPSGNKLTQWIELTLGDRRSENPPFEFADTYIDNAVRCLIYGKGGTHTAPSDAVEFCRRAHWEPALLALPNLQFVIFVGVPAAKSAMGDWVNQSAAGHHQEITLGTNLDAVSD